MTPEELDTQIRATVRQMQKEDSLRKIKEDVCQIGATAPYPFSQKSWLREALGMFAAVMFGAIFVLAMSLGVAVFLEYYGFG